MNQQPKRIPITKSLFVSMMLGIAFAFSHELSANAQIPQPTLQLGANLSPVRGPAIGQGPLVIGGLRVNYTVPGFSAHGLLLPGDILHGSWNGIQYAPLLRIADIEALKSRVGPGRSIGLQVYRPGYGYFYVSVTFASVDGGVYAQFRPGKQQRDANNNTKGTSRSPKHRQEPKRARRK
jgi:hypothetical protein